MAIKNLNFAALIPERDTFTDVDGEVYEVRSKADFGVREMARASKLKTQLPNLFKRLSKEPESEHAANLIEKAFGEMVLMIIPDLPKERLEAMTLGQQQLIMEWWNRLQRERAEEQEKNPETDQAEQ